MTTGDLWTWSMSDWWATRKRLLAWRLMEMANSAVDPAERVRAIDYLSSLNNLHSFEVQHLAQICSPHTAVSLARTPNVDMRFFLTPPPTHASYQYQDLKSDVRELLMRLSRSRNHVCLKYFLSKAFPDYQALSVSLLMDTELGAEGLRLANLGEEDLLPVCLEALLHHCTLRDHAKDLVKEGALPVLYNVFRYFKDNSEVKVTLAKILLKISLYPEFISDIYLTGWVGLLGQWARERDARLSVAAGCALVNLDSLCEGPATPYGREVFLLHPWHRGSRPTVDVVLIHGLLGGMHFTWRQREPDNPLSLFGIASGGDSLESLVSEVREDKACLIRRGRTDHVEKDFEVVLSDIPVSSNVCHDSKDLFSVSGKDKKVTCVKGECKRSNCWPMDWLTEDCDGLRIVATNYQSRISDWLIWCPLKEKGRCTTLECQSDQLMYQLLAAGVGSRPIVWIVHSMGGLILKYMLVRVQDSEDLELQGLVLNTKAVVFLSTPHVGSPLASFSEASRLLFLPSNQVNELRLNSPALIRLHKRFLSLVRDLPIHVTTFTETKSMRIPSLPLEFQCVVPPDFANPGIGEVYEIPLAHMDICKPDSRLSFIYQKILQVVLNVSEQTKSSLISDDK